MQALQLFIADVGFYRGDAPGEAVGIIERIDKCPVVGTVAGRLHDDIAAQPEVIAELPERVIDKREAESVELAPVAVRSQEAQLIAREPEIPTTPS